MNYSLIIVGKPALWYGQLVSPLATRCPHLDTAAKISTSSSQELTVRCALFCHAL